MIIAGTGHRPEKLGGYGDDVFARLVALATDYLETTRPETVISGMALGWDQALAQAAVNLSIPFWAALPGANQPSRWPNESRNKFCQLISHAAKTRCDTEYVTSKTLQDRNKWMVDNCEQLVALYDGGWGGTFNCIQYANKKQKPVVNLWDKWAAE